MIDLGTGPPVVLVPGIQGRWEWMRPAIEAMAGRTRVLSFSLAGEPRSDAPFSDSCGFESFLAQIDAALDRAGITAAAICGVSFGGLVALRYAATRPDRTSALVMVSTPGPGWNPPARTLKYMRHPCLLFPIFCLGASKRSWNELSETFPEWRPRIAAAARYAALVMGAPTSPSRMSRRAALAVDSTCENDCVQITAPTLVITGEPGLDCVVPAATTLEYMRLIKRARMAMLERTGHLGIITQPQRFADLVAGFTVEHAAHHSDRPEQAAS